MGISKKCLKNVQKLSRGLKTQFLDIFWTIFAYLVDAFVWWSCPMHARHNLSQKPGKPNLKKRLVEWQGYSRSNSRNCTHGANSRNCTHDLSHGTQFWEQFSEWLSEFVGRHNFTHQILGGFFFKIGVVPTHQSTVESSPNGPLVLKLVWKVKSVQKVNSLCGRKTLRRVCCLPKEFSKGKTRVQIPKNLLRSFFEDSLERSK